MKNIPKEIYLQISEPTDDFYDHEVSWCEDRQNDSDIKYVLADGCSCDNPLVRTNTEGGEYCGICEKDLL